jgi:hypothetical protein
MVLLTKIVVTGNGGHDWKTALGTIRQFSYDLSFRAQGGVSHSVNLVRVE